MKKYLYDYINEIEGLITNKKINNDILNTHLIKISFFQHERLIHLIVTIFYAVLFLIFLSLGILNYLFLIIAFILLIFLLFYIVHYFRLENGVQYLYVLYDNMKNILNKKSK